MPREYDENGKLINISRARLHCSSWENTANHELRSQIEDEFYTLLRPLISKYKDDVDLRDLKEVFTGLVSVNLAEEILKDWVESRKVKNR